MNIKKYFYRVLHIFSIENERASNRVENANDKGYSKGVDVDIVFEKVRDVITKLADGELIKKTSITMDSCITDDLGFTSISFVELTTELERTLDINIFPIQEWIDEEMTRECNRFMMRSLVSKCTELLTK